MHGLTVTGYYRAISICSIVLTSTFCYVYEPINRLKSVHVLLCACCWISLTVPKNISTKQDTGVVLASLLIIVMLTSLSVFRQHQWKVEWQVWRC